MHNAGLTVCVLAAVLFGGSVIALERQGPRISVKDPRHDLGTVEQGAQPEHIFEITNTGDEVLEIKKIQPT